MKRIVSAAAAILILAACGGSNSMLSTQFAASRTPASPGLVKLVQKSHNGSRVVVDAVLFGPEPGIDLFETRFGVAIGNTAIVKLVPQDMYTQNALVAANGQTIAIDVNGDTDPALVSIDVGKQGGGEGNGFASPSVVLIELAFDVEQQGQTSLTLVGVGGNPPVALDPALRPIAGVTFDTAGASIQGVSTGGGRY